MGRRKQLRRELAETGILTNSFGIEIARLTLNNLLVINEQELFHAIARGSSAEGKCRVTLLNQAFGLTGTWGYDPNVAVALESLKRYKTIVIEYDEDTSRPRFAYNVVTPSAAMKMIPNYVTRAELHSGLEPIHE